MRSPLQLCCRSNTRLRCLESTTLSRTGTSSLSYSAKVSTPLATFHSAIPQNSLVLKQVHTPVVLKQVHVHHVTVATLDGKTFPLPRIHFRWTLGRGACTMLRRQYPLRPSYAATFNGAQGCTLTRCSIDARRDPFVHGHLYVALGRVPHQHALRVVTVNERLSEDGHPLIRNVVWKELLLRDTSSNNRAPLKRPAKADRNLLKRPADSDRCSNTRPCIGRPRSENSV